MMSYDNYKYLRDWLLKVDGRLDALELEKRLADLPPEQVGHGSHVESDVQSEANFQEVRRQLVIMATGAAQASAIMLKLGIDPIAYEMEAALEHLMNAAMMLPVDRDVTRTNTAD